MANPWRAAQQVIGLLDGRWTIAILSLFQGSGRRYQELDDALDSHTQPAGALPRSGLWAAVGSIALSVSQVWVWVSNLVATSRWDR